MSLQRDLTPPPIPPLDKIKHVHIIAVGGTLMGAFAAYLKRAGYRVTGSDQNIYPPMSDVLKEAQVEVFQGYSPGNLMGMSTRPDLVVIGNVVGPNNPEAAWAIENGLVYTSLPAAMEKVFLAETRNLVVAGTHGKTTTSSLLAHLLRVCGKDPSYFIGGVSQDLVNSFHVSSGTGSAKGRPFVLEGDEYDTAFWDKVPKFNHYLPDDVILTSVEFDHADIYADLAAVMRAFEGLADRIRPGGRMIACWDHANVRKIAERFEARVGKDRVVSYGSTPEARESGVRFWVTDEHVEDLHSGAKHPLRLQLPGMHNRLNATAVLIEAGLLGISAADALSALARFRGVKRRQEVKGEIQGRLVIDDFAHHPTAVRETLKALRSRYPGRRMITVFEPRSATSRRKVFQADFAKSFADQSDAVYVSQPYDQTKIAADDQFSSDQLIADIRSQGTDAHLMLTVDEGVTQVAQASQVGDVIAVLSNGGFDGFIPKLLKTLSV